MRLALTLPGPLSAWQLTDLSQLLRAWTMQRTRVVLSAEAPSAWLDEWSEALADAEVEVEFCTRGRRGRRAE